MSRTRIKICGLTREADVLAAVEAGADAIGFVFYAKSARYVSPPRAAELARLLPPFVTPVGLFVNAQAAETEAALQALPNMLLQFHGDESPAECGRFGRPFVRAARMEPGFDLINYAEQYSAAQAILLDAHVEGYGGGGKVFDWSLIPKNLRSPVVLSGGLHAGNVLAGMTQLRPWAVDVSSGVEAQGRGLKCARLMREFCDAVRQADALIASKPDI